MTKLLRTQAAMLLSLLVLSVMAFGATPRWAWATWSALSLMILVAWVATVLLAKESVIVWSPMVLVFIAGLFFVTVQMWAGRSPDPYGTREAGLKLLTYAAIYWTTLQVIGASAVLDVQGFAKIVTIYGAAIALFGICQFIASPGTVYGTQYDGSPFGPYINHNHFAGLIELLFPVALASVLNPSYDGARAAMAGFALVLMICAVVLAGSRGGAICVAIEAVTLVMVEARGMDSKRWKVRSAAVVCIVLGAVAGFAILDSGGSARRYKELLKHPAVTVADRGLMARDAVRVWMAHPFVGAGVGSYSLAVLSTNSVSGERVVDHAHNDYLELLAEGGLVAGLIAVVGVTLLFVSMSQHLKQARATFDGLLKFAVGVGCLGFLLHSVADFNFHIPANAAWFAAYLAIITAPTRTNSFESTTRGELVSQ